MGLWVRGVEMYTLGPGAFLGDVYRKVGGCGSDGCVTGTGVEYMHGSRTESGTVVV